MFSVEMDEKTSEIKVICDDNLYPDLEVIIGAAEIFIRQYDEATDSCDVVRISNKMFAELWLAMDKEEGNYKTVIKK